MAKAPEQRIRDFLVLIRSTVCRLQLSLSHHGLLPGKLGLLEEYGRRHTTTYARHHRDHVP